MDHSSADFLIKTADSLDAGKVEAFFRSVLPKAVRVEGVFKDRDDVWHHADGVNSQVQIRPLGREAETSYFVVVPRPNVNIRNTVRRGWMQHCAVCFSLS
ncbi:hypothetical protein [Mailhella sp.]|uniref:hypothetical protein n=1 Tax=Mailhella sp. TaxID=1981029 RepID=UPI004064A4CD